MFGFGSSSFSTKDGFKFLLIPSLGDSVGYTMNARRNFAVSVAAADRRDVTKVGVTWCGK